MSNPIIINDDQAHIIVEGQIPLIEIRGHYATTIVKGFFAFMDFPPPEGSGDPRTHSGMGMEDLHRLQKRAAIHHAALTHLVKHVTLTAAQMQLIAAWALEGIAP